MIGSDSVLQPTSGLAIEAFDDAMLIWDESGQKLHHLDLVSATVWEELDGRSLGEIARDLAGVFDTDEHIVQRDVITLGNTLLTQGLAFAKDV